MRNQAFSHIEAHHFNADPRDKLFPGENTLVVPLRNPVDAYITWRGRKTARQMPDVSWEKLWRNLNDAYLDPELRVYVVPVDVPDVRDECLRKLEAEYGVEFSTDWSKRASQPELRVPFDPVDLSAVYALEIVKAFYPDPDTVIASCQGIA